MRCQRRRTAPDSAASRKARMLASVARKRLARAPKDKLDSMMLKIKTLQPGNTKLFVIHVGLDSPEMSAMEDANPFGPKEMSKHRNGELNALVSPQFQQQLHDPKFRLVNYRMMNDEKGISSMKRPSAN